MKYVQFTELKNLLETNGYSLNNWKSLTNTEFIKEDNGLFLKDKEKKGKDDLETKSAISDIGNLSSPKKALMRRKLNNNARTLQDGINKTLGDKYIKPLVKQRIELYKKMAQVATDKTPKEMVEQVKDDLNTMKNIQKKQVAIIEKAAETIINNATKKINSAIEKSSMKDSNKSELSSYWALLCVQIQSNLLKKLYVMNKDVLAKIAPNEEERKKMEAIMKATVDKQMAKKEKELQEKKKEQIESIKQKESAVEHPESDDVSKTEGSAFVSQEEAIKKKIEK